MKSMIKLNGYAKYFLIMMITLGAVSCNNDDDLGIDDNGMDDNYTGSITAMDQTISQDSMMIMIQSVTVGQDSWLVATHSEEETSNNWIAEPVWVEEGTTTDIEMMLNNDANLMEGEDGNEIALMLYADNPTDGTQGEWDDNDVSIYDEDGIMLSETITVTLESNTSTNTFADYDLDGDGFLDDNEIRDTYENDFTNWDTDGDGSLNDEEFSNTTFANTDANDDDGIDEDEWNAGNTGLYSNYSGENDFNYYDTDADGIINSDEWRTGYADSNWYGTYDANTDNLVSEDEWDTGLYNDWDADADGLINEDEYNNYSVYTGGWYNTI